MQRNAFWRPKSSEKTRRNAGFFLMGRMGWMMNVCFDWYHIAVWLRVFFKVRVMMINRSCITLYIGLIDIGCFLDNLLSYSKTSYCNRGNNNKHTVEVSVYLWWCRWKLKRLDAIERWKKFGLSEVIKGNPMKPADAKQCNGMKQVFFVIDPLSIQCYILSYPYHLQSH